MEDESKTSRNHLVDQLIGAGRARSGPVIEALRAVPRHLFLPGVEPERVYQDEAIVTRWGDDGQPVSSSSQPSIMAEMLEQLGLAPGHRVLEVGAGTGYNAALMAHLVGETGVVTTIDIDDDLVASARRNLGVAGLDRVGVVCGDGAHGWPENSPYDRIILTVGAWDVSPAWFDQLAEDGRLVLPLSLCGVQCSVAFERCGDDLVSTSIVGCGFMPLRGALAGPDTVRPIGDETGLFLKLDDERSVDAAALAGALGQPGEVVSTGVRVTPGEVMGGLGLWVALHERDAGQLSAVGAAAARGVVPPLVAFPGWALTAVLVGTEGLAALTRHPPIADPAGSFELGVQGFGPDHGDLADRLSRRVHDWDVGGRPGTAELRIRASPRTKASPGTKAGSATGAGDDDAVAIVVDKHHYRLLLSYPRSRSARQGTHRT